MKALWIGVFALMTFSSAAIAAAASKAADPAEADRSNPAYVWDLSDLYPSPEAWTAAQQKAKAQVETLEKYKGTLGNSAKAMLEAFAAFSDAGKEVARLNVYASLKGDEDVRIAANQERVPNAVLHPMVRTHPENAAQSIYVNPIRIEGIVGLDHKEALPLLAELIEHATQECFQYRHAWQPGDLVIWDNRCLLHKANGDYDMNEVRYLYRVMLQGDVPQ